MVLKPIKRALVPSPLEDQRAFDEFVTQYLNKCDDLLSYTKRYPVVKQTPLLTVQRQNRNPHEDHRWLRRNVTITAATYDDLKSVLFVNRDDHLARWTPLLQGVEKVESIVPNLCDVYRYAFKSQGMKAKRDYCQLVIKREFLGETARPKPRIFTPSASMANLALTLRSQSSTNLAIQTSGLMSPPQSHQQYHHHHQPGEYNSVPASPMSPISPGTDFYKGMKNARSVMDFHNADFEQGSYPPPPPLPTHYTSQTQYVGLSPHDSMRQPRHNPGNNINDDDDDDSIGETDNRPIRRFQIVTIPMLHRNCTSQRGYVRAFYETYEEVCEYSDGTVRWTCIHHSDFSGWVPSFMADHSIANAFPREAESLVDYIQKIRAR
ncbi:hypothetical protein GGI07_004361 [Coemansia sp. Benny D115]|nr:hypothetical protein GGI07_004361 [Coemansia sp. Benny D115]